MIEQRINLYQERFHEKRVWVSAARVSLALLFALALIGAWSYLLHSELGTLERQNQQARDERNRLTADLAVVNAELARLLEDTRLDEEIGSASRQISARRKVLNFVDANRFGSGQGFSEYLVALSNLDIDEVWLEHIRLAQDYVHIRGSSLDAEIVPRYFDRFGQQPVFRGNRFDLFRVSRERKSEWKVDFEIATREAANE